MKLTTLIAATLGLAATTLSAADSSLYIPAAGSGPGAAGSQWRSEVTFHNVAAQGLPVDVYLYTAEGAKSVTRILLGPNDTVTASDLIGNQLEAGGNFGGLEIRGDSTRMKKLAVTSRAINNSALGEFGQDVPSQRTDDAFIGGDTAVIIGPYRVAEYRFNFGLLPVENTTVEWRLVRKNGTVAATRTITHAALKHVQYNNGVSSLFGSTAQDDDVVHAKIASGRAFLFGSIINAGTGDPSYVPALRVRENLAATFIGVDLDENGSVDIRDADGNGVLDAPVEVITGSFPNYFRIVATDEDGGQITYALVNPSKDAKFIDTIGTLQWVPAGSLKGTTGTITIRIFDGFDTQDVTIPVNFI